MSDTYLGIDIGGTKILSGLVDKKGNVTEMLYSRTQTERGRKDLLTRLKEIIKSYSKKGQHIKGIGVSTGGRVDFNKGIVMYATALLPDWKGTNLKKFIEDEFSIPCLVENDANCALIAEKMFGAGKSYSNVVMFTLGTGLGSAIILDNKLVRGKDGLGGELGHVIIKEGGRKCSCGKRGCLETYTSGWAAEKEANKLIKFYPKSLLYRTFGQKKERISMKLIIEMAKKGDEFATILVDKLAYYSAIGIDAVVNALGVERFIVGGGIAEGGGVFLLNRIRNECKKLSPITGAFSKNISLAQLNNRAGMIDAAMLFSFCK
jgi:glucokinase